MSLADFKPPRRSLLSRILPGRVPAPAPVAVSVMHLEDVVNDEALRDYPEYLSFGAYPDGVSRFLVDDVALVRHTAVYGGAGFSQGLFVQYLLAQQLGRGGGFFFVDENQEERVAGGLERAAEALGIPFTAVDTSAGYGTAYALVESAENSEAVYVSLPNFAATPAHTEARDSLCEQVLEMVRHLHRPASEGRPAHPFIVVLPSSLLFRLEHWPTLLVRARAAGIAFVILESRLIAQDYTVGAHLRTLEEHTWNKVFFRVGAQDAAREAAGLVAQTIETSGESSYRAEQIIKTCLLRLEQNESVSMCGNSATRLRLPVLDWAAR